jgi:hypothetical protein
VNRATESPAGATATSEPTATPTSAANTSANCPRIRNRNNCSNKSNCKWYRGGCYNS